MADWLWLPSLPLGSTDWLTDCLSTVMFGQIYQHLNSTLFSPLLLNFQIDRSISRRFTFASSLICHCVQLQQQQQQHWPTIVGDLHWLPIRSASTTVTSPFLLCSSSGNSIRKETNTAVGQLDRQIHWKKAALHWETVGSLRNGREQEHLTLQAALAWLTTNH